MGTIISSVVDSLSQLSLYYGFTDGYYDDGDKEDLNRNGLEQSMYKMIHDFSSSPLARQSVTAVFIHKEREADKIEIENEFDENEKVKSITELYKEEIEKIWAERTAANKTLFNGLLFKLLGSSISYEERINVPILDDKNNEKREIIHGLELRVCLTDYKTFLGTNRNPNAEICNTFKEYGLLSNALGVTGIVFTSDGFFPLIKRSIRCGEYPGYYDMPGGHPEPLRIPNSQYDSQSIVNEIYDSILHEISDEINIPLKDLSDPMLLAVTSGIENHGKPSLIFLLSTTLTKEEITTLYLKGGEEKYESTHLLWLHFNLHDKSISLTDAIEADGTATMTTSSSMTTPIASATVASIAIEGESIKSSSYINHTFDDDIKSISSPNLLCASTLLQRLNQKQLEQYITKQY